MAIDREQIIELGRKAGFSKHEGIITGGVSDLERFAELVASDERERIKEANAPEIGKVNAELKKLSEENTKLWGWYHDAEQQLAIWQRRGKTK